MGKGLLLKVEATQILKKFLSCSLPLVHVLSQKSFKTFCSGPSLILYSPFMSSISKWSVIFRLSGQHFVLCSSGKLRLVRYLRSVCSVAWYSPDEVMWYSDYCIKTSITYITVTLPKPRNFLAADAFGTGIFHRHLWPWNRYQPHTPLLHFASLFPHFLTPKFSI
jgi:hypothetical protein